MRIGLIEQVQEMISAGTYDTDERLDVAVDRLLDDLGLPAQPDDRPKSIVVGREMACADLDATA